MRAQKDDSGEKRRQKEIARNLSHDLERNFETFVRTYQDRVYAFAVSLTKDPHGAEEIAQDTFVRAYRALRGYDTKRIRALSLRAWLYQIALNLIRNSKRRKPFETVPVERSAHVASAERAEKEAEQRELVSFVRNAVSRLPAHLRAAIVLRYLDDLSYEEISGITAQPVGTIKSNVHRGLAMLKKDLPYVDVS